ncbi:YbaB/EbfC family nucleoid-associated protein [Tuwongella immobilis]|uniref:Nucleoid-associated protein GMBLW1_31110 n=1 Tax=Tuwongella immobilis TaxID=692036 RepID=A0A6C2YHV8_9BACT|nr:YbaB/EbfC family nucleoid-associated protein [Tuwongella immobilis]VIP00849.1 Nucleoid-associated protein Sinac_1311 OS=Singulisphaera acidiphila (strain ATCC BAA-1392 / DSM 18658 / VKM B-2454 / MOB10) GN=Sinac_1311 PE=3 SV=1: YbaB_DNA_bd [Tuwongella immobilis]VTR97116.1 Nucleoid-associated protein Sinac_1311 OS=Singulisphaera acidiphila (strain ATCC BAA-1392 / DSM 18658 / VKM B-2454 / MOB10) GN=Sinac_1311 PE=3 SV=1: YbaB_DNA_bd [Tuwongella immobilis]
MFKEMGQIMGMLRNLPKMQEQMEQMQQSLGNITAEGQAGGGMVAAKLNGRMELVSCTISEEAMKLNDREMLEDLIVAAVNAALVKVREQVAQESSKFVMGAGGFPMG